MIKGKFIHCEGIAPCSGTEDPSYRHQNWGEQEFREEFLNDFNLGYILDIALKNKIHFHIATHLEATKTCKDKAAITGIPLEQVIKGYYMANNLTEDVYGLMIPGNLTHNKKKVASLLGIDTAEADNVFSKSKWLPIHMENGTVHPFANHGSFNSNGSKGKLARIIFDKKTLEQKGLGDFSFTTHASTGRDNFRTSIQINPHDAYDILSMAFPGRIYSADITQ